MITTPKQIAADSRRILRLFALIAVLSVALFVQSCTKAAIRQNTLMMPYDRGDYKAVIDSIERNSKKFYGENNEFLYNMDIGLLYHYMGDFESSNRYLQQAAEVYDELFTRSVTNEAAALLTNDNVRPYRAKPYELVTLHQIAALNFMAQGNFESALVESRKAQILFNEWERTNAKYQSDGMFHLFSSLAFEAEREQDNSLISLFKSVQAYNASPVKLPSEVETFAYNRLVAGDRENDVQTLNIAPRSQGNGWDAAMGQSEIIVVGHTGYGPDMTQVKLRGTYTSNGRLRMSIPAKNRQGDIVYGARYTIDIPAPPLPDGKSSSTPVQIAVALPVLNKNRSETAYYSVQVDGVGDKFETVIVNDMDLQAEKALDDAWGDIVLRTVTRVVLRTIAADQAKKVNTGNEGLNLLKNIATDIASIAVEQADTRMPLFMPQTMQATRIQVEPGTYTVSLRVHNRRGDVIGRRVFENVEVAAGQKRILLHNSLK